ncbi:hypothetical protein BAUCODRAFT_515072 [Baudoinia panamericana UAMH 10762]|uniref:Uncharacterized protein n=1 Tax=Baudoinia panamericana (strain UAMH 10762) TaxID=717646 RepID=M2MHI2_BAUPA|nr:uncharacterized protein BAUCODRAFT_515072 [Baudoinia panamericana UAMH 10762]EMC96061.1 hypothetical protein BAUCODRAFT_515072 [Baudoinia panamericana UAMH 10762]
MRFSTAAVAGFAAVALAQNTTVAPVYVTDVVTAFTTYCPSSTQLTHNGVTYTITSATTFTITDCPCTVTRPVTSSQH